MIIAFALRSSGSYLLDLLKIFLICSAMMLKMIDANDRTNKTIHNNRNVPQSQTFENDEFGWDALKKASNQYSKQESSQSSPSSTESMQRNHLPIDANCSTTLDAINTLNGTDNLPNQKCSEDLNQWCDPSLGKCRCRPESPVYLSEEIPCLRYKRLGDLCIHSSECHQIEHAACVATFLYSVKTLRKTPNYKQWFFYNKIHNDDDINYLLNKLYGRCRCQQGFRAKNPFECIRSGIQTPFQCHHQSDCLAMKASCDFDQNRCLCPKGWHFDYYFSRCREIRDLHGRFCASSSDCFLQQSNMECKNSACVCLRNYTFHNQTGCILKDICSDGGFWNTTIHSCQSSQSSTIPFSSIAFCTFIIKTFPIILVTIIIFNLFCYVRGRKNSIQPYEMDDFLTTTSSSSTTSRVTRPQFFCRRYDRIDLNDRSVNRIQSISLLSLPDYETVLINSNNNNNNNINLDFNDSNTASLLSDRSHRHHHPNQNEHLEQVDSYQNNEEHLPSYEEAIQTMKKSVDLKI